MNKKTKFTIVALIVVITGSIIFAANSKKEKTAWELMEEKSGKTEIAKSEVENDKTLKTNSKAKVTFIELGSENCMPCKMMKPVMEKVEEKYKEVEVIFYDVWTEEGKPYGDKYGIQSIPTQIFLDENGKEYYRHTGFLDFESLEKVLQQKGVK